MTDVLGDIERGIHELRSVLGDVLDRRNIGNSGNIVKIEGAGSIWGGLAIGVTIGAAIAGSVTLAVWMSNKTQQYDASIRQAEAYRSAVYMLAPRFAEAIDNELKKQKEINNEQPDPDSDPAD